MVKRIIGMFFFVVAVISLVWLVMPLSREVRSLVINGDRLANQPGELGEVEFPQKVMLAFDWESKVRAGEEVVYSLALKQNEGSGSEGRNLFELYHVVTLTRMELPGWEISPEGVAGQPLREGEELLYEWSGLTKSEGRSSGVVWVYLQFFPVGGGEMIEKVAWALPFEVNAKTLLGMGSRSWWVICIVSFLAGLVMVILALKAKGE